MGIFTGRLRLLSSLLAQEGPWGAGGGGKRGPKSNPWSQGANGESEEAPNVQPLFRRRSSGGGGSGGRSSGEGGPDFRALLSGKNGFRLFFLLAVVLVGLWLFSGLYRVEIGHTAVKTRFGAHIANIDTPGLKWHWPSPIENVVDVWTEKQYSVYIGTNPESGREIMQESRVLTSDQNILRGFVTVQYNIAEADKYLFILQEPDETVKIAAESVFREVMAQKNVEGQITEKLNEIIAETTAILQDVLDSYNSGIVVDKVLIKLQPPEKVQEAFEDVQAAQQEEKRRANEALKERNKLLNQANGTSAKLLEDAKRVKGVAIAEAEGEAARFLEYGGAFTDSPELTSQRLYLETMEKVYASGNLTILADDLPEGIILNSGRPGSQVVPFSGSSN